MKLLTKTLEQTFIKLGSQESVEDPMVITKFFAPRTNRTRYATEYDPHTKKFFGLVDGHETELGYFCLDELQNFKGRFGMGIERDLHFESIPLSVVQKSLSSYLV